MSSEIANRPVKILIIDDDPEWRDLIGWHVQSLGYAWEAAKTFTEVKEKLQQAEESHYPFSLVTIDAVFKVGQGNQETYLGYTILSFIKSMYPHLPCIMISGDVGIGGEKVLDLREEYNLDYYFSKINLNPKELDAKIKKALARVEQLKYQKAEAPVTAPANEENWIDLVKLRDTLNSYFNESELRDLCFELGVDYDELRGEGKKDKTRELVMYLSRHGRIVQLWERCHEIRPNIAW